MVDHPDSILSTETVAVRAHVLERIPYPIAHFLGYRRETPPPENTYIQILWSFIGVFSSIAAIELVSRQVPLFRAHGGPIIVGSFVCHPDPTPRIDGVDPLQHTVANWLAWEAVY
jgi:hypothetical protein